MSSSDIVSQTPQEWQEELAKRDVDSEGFVRENRPISCAFMLSMRYRGRHLDTCVKTENGWICTDTCHIEERGGGKLIKTIKTPLKIYKILSKSNWYGKYEWAVKQSYEVRTFYDGRSLRTRNQEINIHTFGEGTKWLKFRAQRTMIDCVEKNMADA